MLDKFFELNKTQEGNLSDDEVKQFVEEHFSPPGSEFVEWEPGDWTEK